MTPGPTLVDPGRGERLESTVAPAPRGRSDAQNNRSDAHRDSARAVRAAGMIGSSLLLTQAIGFLGNNIVVTRLLEKHYGPVRFADSFAMLGMMALNLGVDTYIRKEVPIRPEHAKEFASGVLGARVIMGVSFMIISSFIISCYFNPNCRIGRIINANK